MSDIPFDNKVSLTIEFIRKLYNTDKEFIALHEPKFIGNEKKYVNDAIDSTFVSSVGKYVDLFEKNFAQYVGAKNAVATVNGTAALHTSLIISGVQNGTEVITQPLTFIATCNAISYTGATPVFVDVDRDTLGLSPDSLEEFLREHAKIGADGFTYNKTTNKKISACVPMHTFGHPVKIDRLVEICARFNIPMIEDAAESLGSYYNGQHTGTFGDIGTFSFNGNKVLTTGGGGMIVTNDEKIARLAKHITTTARIPHPYEIAHDMVGYNYRMPNLNAALGCAQLQSLDKVLDSKKMITAEYRQFFKNIGFTFIEEPGNSRSNFWLNAIQLENIHERDTFLAATNQAGVMTRPIWKLMTELEMYKNCFCGDLSNAKWLEERVVNLPSSSLLKKQSNT
ncbi:MAG: LegC family aminotransferase [Spirochaetia bacterium]|nr:LegC family aminotransferase [Spirochaetia bacterium]